MQDQGYYHRALLRKSRGTVVRGQDVKIRVRRHQLEITDGFPLEAPQETRRITRATSRVERVLFCAGSGFLTVDALDFCGLENDIPIVAVTQSGALRWTLLPGAGGAYQSALRRSQALAPFTEVGLEIARWLVVRKITGQRDVLRELAGRVPAAWPTCTIPEAREALETILPRVERAPTIPALRQIEAEAADVYWAAWVGFPLHFAPPSYLKKVPSHWTTFRGRGSPLNNGNRNAADPVNALVNYSGALLAAESLLAIHESGLDPYLAILHTDRDTRRSLVYDIMEPVRPIADRLTLNLLLSHAFRPGELWALRDGRCRLDQDLCAKLWPWMPAFRQALGPVMTFLLSRLRRGPRYGERVAYRLVQVPPPVRTRAPLGQKRWANESLPPPIRPARVCRSCGLILEGERSDRRYCDDCSPEQRAEIATSALAVGRGALGRLRTEGRDPAHDAAAAHKRGAKVARANRERAHWLARADGAVSPELFRRDILPHLGRLPVRRIAQAIGVSPGYASFIRRGLRVPHPQHWEALKKLISPRGGL